MAETNCGLHSSEKVCQSINSAELDQLVAVVDEVDQLGAEQVVIGPLVDWLRTHQHLDAVCKKLLSIGSQILQS